MRATASIAMAIALAMIVVGCGKPGAAASTAEVLAAYAAKLPPADPLSAAWQGVVEHGAALLPQDVTEPRLLKPSATSLVRVRALHDGARLALRLEWNDATEDRLLGPGRFSDSVAVQIPARSGAAPSAFMGEVGKPVRITFWRAAWQEAAMNAPEKVVKALYPNATVDHYPFDAAKSKAARAALARQYAPAVAAGNPGAPPPEGAGPAPGTTQDLEAEGFGTLTPRAGSRRSTGEGRWKKGVWTAVITLPISEESGAALAPGRRTYVAFAVWDGGDRHVGGRKLRSNWIALTLAPSAGGAR